MLIIQSDYVSSYPLVVLVSSCVNGLNLLWQGIFYKVFDAINFIFGSYCLVPVRHHGTVQNSWPRGNGSLSIWQSTHDPGQENAVSPDEVQKGQYYLDDI